MRAVSSTARTHLAAGRLVTMSPVVDALVFVGGESRRMGSDKARLQFADGPLLARVVRAVSHFDSVTLVGGRPDLIELGTSELSSSQLSLGHVADRFPGEGPLGAMISGMSALSGDVVLAVACDLPELSRSYVDLLVAQRALSDADLCVPLIGGIRQWHCAVWHRRTAEHLTRAFDDGERSVFRAARGLTEVTSTTERVSVLRDLDSPEDVQRFLDSHAP
ncbi:MAG: molybdopterin-guanine dinucleotide biosynthesis protein A [Verrucomicrobiales bacterium]